jgi:transcription-repair coupling factor (superfamily II helicase)
VIAFRNNTFPDPDALVKWIAEQGSLAKLRPDMKIVVMRNWDKPEERLRGARQLMAQLQKLAKLS